PTGADLMSAHMSPLTTDSRAPMAIEEKPRSNVSNILRRLQKSPSAVAGGVIVLGFLLVAAVALVYTPYDPIDQDLRASLQGPSSTHWLGTDEFGRDILS